MKNAVGENADLFFKNIGDVLNKLPSGFLGIPWFQLKTMINYDEQGKSKTKSLSKTKTRMQDKIFLNEISKEKEYLEVRN